MLLLYPYRTPLIFYAGIGLHSTMLLLYRYIQIRSEYLPLLYIPLCFYYIQFCHKIIYLSNDLYIPLCFYYIYLEACLISLTSSLHSTMLLLYLNGGPASIRHIAQLYIPLCFYYILLWWSLNWAVFAPLHSTMLLLYLEIIKISFSSLSIFTFHYASTISLCSPSIFVPL